MTKREKEEKYKTKKGFNSPLKNIYIYKNPPIKNLERNNFWNKIIWRPFFNLFKLFLGDLHKLKANYIYKI